MALLRLCASRQRRTHQFKLGLCRVGLAIAKLWRQNLLPYFMNARTQSQNLEKFGELVLADPALHDQLRATENVLAFAARAVRLGAERGLVFSEAIVLEAVQAKQREWLKRWL